MAKFKKSDFKPFREHFGSLSKERREKIEAGAAVILKEMHLAELRKAMNVTQTTLSRRAGMKQAEISRIENNPESVQIKTMERYVRGLGGEFKLVAEFPDGTHAEIPLNAGRPIKSKLSVTSGNDGEELERTA